jgi:hypothetical protein
MNRFDFFNYYDIRVKLGDGSKSVSMICEEYDPKDFMVIFADPEKLKPIINKHNAGRPASYLTPKAMNAWGGLRAARIDSRKQESVPSPASMNSSLPMAVIDFVIAKNKIFCRFTNGVTRCSELIRQCAEFIPIQTNTKCAELAYQMVGSKIAPIPATAFLVPEEIHLEYLRKFPPINGRTRRAHAVKRLQEWVFKKNPITDFHL